MLGRETEITSALLLQQSCDNSFHPNECQSDMCLSRGEGKEKTSSGEIINKNVLSPEILLLSLCLLKPCEAHLNFC